MYKILKKMALIYNKVVCNSTDQKASETNLSWKENVMMYSTTLQENEDYVGSQIKLQYKTEALHFMLR